MQRGAVLSFLLIPALTVLIPFSASGELKCTHSMTITDPRYGVMASVGTKVTFNDIGCAVVWRNLQCTMDQMAFDQNAHVQDYNTGGDVPMAQAFFAMGCGLLTPMGYDVAAFARREDADAFASGKPGCRVLTYDELLTSALR